MVRFRSTCDPPWQWAVGERGVSSEEQSAAGVDGDAAPPGRRAEEDEDQGDDGGDQQPQEVEPGLLLRFVAAAHLAHADGWLIGCGRWPMDGWMERRAKGACFLVLAGI